MRLSGVVLILAFCALASPSALPFSWRLGRSDLRKGSAFPAARVPKSEKKEEEGCAALGKAKPFRQSERPSRRGFARVATLQASPLSAAQSPPPQPQQGQPAPAAGGGVKLEPAQLNALLHKVYMAAFRFTDLLSILQTDKWKMEDAARQSFNQTLETVRGQLKALDESRQQFQEKPENSDLADRTAAAITALLPNIDLVAAAVTQYDGLAQGTQYKQPGDQLRELQESLRAYILYLHAQAEAALAPPPGGQTEMIHPPTTASDAIPADIGSAPPTQPKQITELLHHMYMTAFRIQDLLGQEQPEKWKASDAERAGFNQAREALRAKLAEFEKVRSQFAASPASADLAFQTYRALASLQQPLEQVSHSVSAREDARLGDEYEHRSRELAAGQEQLVPYISYFLNRWDRATQMFQNDLAACENQLSTAMRNRVQVPAPLPNVNPQFQGHRRKGTSRRQAAAQTATKKQ